MIGDKIVKKVQKWLEGYAVEQLMRYFYWSMSVIDLGLLAKVIHDYLLYSFFSMEF